MPVSVAYATAGATTGERADLVRAAFGTHRAPTGVSAAPSNRTEGLDDVRARVDAPGRMLGRRLTFVIGKPGLDGQSNGAEQIAARERGMTIHHDGIRLTPEEIVAAAAAHNPHVLGLSMPSDSHLPLIAAVMDRIPAAGLGDIPVVAGGIIPDDDRAALAAMGVARFIPPRILN